MNSANEKLWCILIPGHYDLYAAPSHEMAEHMAACHNADMAEYFRVHPEKLEHWGVTFDEIKARVVEWTHDAEEHAEDLADFDPDEWAMKDKP